MERETGIEPAPSAWKAEVLPLNYSRAGNCMPQRETGGGRWIRTTEGVSQQIYSLPPLAAWVSLQLLLPDRCALRRNRFGVKQPVILLWDACGVNKNLEQFHRRWRTPLRAARIGSDVEAEMQHVAFLDAVFLAFET